MADALLRMAERVARLGAWRVDLPAFTSTWSDEVRAIRELPDGFVPILNDAIESYVPEDRPVIRAAVAACAEYGTPFDVELRLVIASGRQIQVRVIGEAVRDNAGVICRLEGAIQDVTARRATEDEARRLAGVVSETLEHISDGFVTLDREWRFTFLNREAERQVGRSREATVGRVVWEVYPELVGSIFETSYRHAMASGETVEFEAWFEPLSAWYSVRVYPAPQGLAIYFANITQQREAREEARISEERFRLLAQATNDAIWDTDIRTGKTWRNEGFQKLFGYSAEEQVVIDDWALRVHAEDRDRVVAGVQRALEDGSESWRDEYRYLRPDGGSVHVFARGSIIRDHDGTPLRIIGGMTDLTERKKLEAQFLRAQRLESIGTLAGGIAHDLNNILSPILMSAGLLRDEETDPNRISLLDTIEISGRRGSDMVRQVLAFARGVEGKRMQVNARHLFRDVQKILRETIPKNIDVQFMTPHDLWTMNADPTQLHQVLMNLCVNARDAMPDGGTLKVSAANLMLDEVYTGLLGPLTPGPHLVITVSDSGSGMSRETQERVFEPFFTTKEVGKGTGLGLSTVLTIVKSHGGAIDVQSAVGLGTTFTIHLPALHEQAADAVSDERAFLRGNGELVLVIDDEEQVRTVTQKTLERFGFKVLVARHGAEGVAAYAQHPDVAIVLTDMAMPVMDGFVTITALRAINPSVRVLASSGLATKDAHERAVAAGANAFILKPYTVDVLIRAIHDVLNSQIPVHRD
jgi:two-component system cell cycle sensor histidine kinase/response regulator CckA